MKPLFKFFLALATLALSGLLTSNQTAATSTAQAHPPFTNDPQADEIAEAFDIPLDIAFSLLILHRRFGQSDTGLLPTSGLIIGLISEEQHGYLRESIKITQAALGNSNAEKNLGAPPKPTGDRLFDLYAEAVFEQIQAIPLGEITSDEAMYAAALPDTIVAVWELEFGHDPRYWELRYFCAMFYPGENQLSSGFDNRVDFLRHSQETGIATANTLLLLYEEITLEAREATGASDLGVLIPTAEAQAILDATTATWPDECWPWYYRALHSYRSGNMDQAMADLELGNKASVNVYPRPFPFSFVESHFGGKSPPGSAAISGAILLAAQPYRLPSLIKWKRFQQQSLDGIVDKSGMGLLNHWQNFACNLAQSDKIDIIHPMGALTIVRKNFDFMEKTKFGHLVERESEVIWRGTGASEAILDLMRENGAASTVFDGAEVLGMAGGVQGIPVAWYLGAELDFSTLAKNVKGFNDLRMIDFITLEMPDEMLKYEALTPEDLEQRKAERKARNAGD